MAEATPLVSDDIAELDTPALVAHILQRYHQVHRAELPSLINRARKVEAVHADHPECPSGLARFLEEVEDVLDGHMAKEEEILFPMMLSAAPPPMIRMPISVMESEHEDHLKTLAALRRLTGGLEPPEDACGTWCGLYAGLAKLADDLSAHIEIENSLLFPRF